MILTVTPNPCVDKTLFLDVLTPGAKHRNLRVATVAGGKGCNVARAVKTLGYSARAMIIAGGPTGQHVIDMIEKDDGVPCVPVWVQGMTRTITTILEEDVHRQTPLFEPGPAVTEAEKGAFLKAFEIAVKDAAVVTLNGAVTSPKTLHDLYAECITRARAAGAKVILDSYGPEFLAGLQARPHVIKPNLEEAEALVGFPLNDQAAQHAAIQWFLGHGIEAVILSMGAAGVLFSDGRHTWRITPPAIEEVNPVGSGDALVAGIAIGLAQGWPWEQSLPYAMAAGTANAKTWDIGHFDPEEVKQLATQMDIQNF